MLDERGLAPKKSLGQNFLIDANLVRKLIDASDASEGDLVLEVGPGAGALTEGLLDRGCRVVACELDEGLADLVSDRFASRRDRFRLIRGDCLRGKRAINDEVLAALAGGPFSLISNLPYNVASPLMMTLLLEHPACRGLWVTIQKEVADRLLAPPGSRAYGEVSVVAQATAELERIATVSASCFWPRPTVTSAMIGMVRRATARVADPRRLQSLCRTLFTHRRKQLGAILKDRMHDRVWPSDVQPIMRPEQLTIEQLDALASAMNGFSSASPD